MTFVTPWPGSHRSLFRAAAVAGSGRRSRTPPPDRRGWRADSAPAGKGPLLDARAGARLALSGGVELELIDPWPDASQDASRLWTAQATPSLAPADYLPVHGHPIGYRYLAGQFPLADHQTVYASVPGSAEMPSAGRPFTESALVQLMARGIAVAPIVLHAGASSPELHEPPQPEREAVPPSTVAMLDAVRESGGRVVAVGTTVARALETVTDEDGRLTAKEGWTDLVLGPERPTRVVDGLVTGLHPPEASHLALLVAVGGDALVQRAYDHAVAGEYLWHEFGDSMLLLPTRGRGWTQPASSSRATLNSPRASRTRIEPPRPSCRPSS